MRLDASLYREAASSEETREFDVHNMMTIQDIERASGLKPKTQMSAADDGTSIRRAP
jgi:hypothetical protein